MFDEKTENKVRILEENQGSNQYHIDHGFGCL